MRLHSPLGKLREHTRAKIWRLLEAGYHSWNTHALTERSILGRTSLQVDSLAGSAGTSYWGPGRGRKPSLVAISQTSLTLSKSLLLTFFSVSHAREVSPEQRCDTHVLVTTMRRVPVMEGFAGHGVPFSE